MESEESYEYISADQCGHMNPCLEATISNKEGEDTIYETSLNEKARKYDEMQKTMQGPLYKLFMQQMECKLNIMYSMHKGYGSISEHCKTIERLDYEILEHLAGSLKSNMAKEETEA